MSAQPVYEIPTSNTLPFYRFSITLSGNRYTLELRHNSRLDRWFLNILDVLGAPVLMGVPLVVNRNVLAPYRTLQVPPGSLFVIDTTGNDYEPTLSSFISTHLLLYADPSA